MNRTPRVSVTVKINLKYPDRTTFVERFAQNISRTGLFVRAQDPLAVGSRVSFEYVLADGSQILRGTGVVRWARSPAEAREPDLPPGMGLEFTDLDPASETLVAQIVRRHGEGARAPRRPRPTVAPPAPTPGPAARAARSLDAEEASLLAGLDEQAAPAAGLLDAEALARAVANEGFEGDPTAAALRAAPVAWLALDLAGTDVCATDGREHAHIVPRLSRQGNRLRVGEPGTYLPALSTCLGQPWPAPQPAAFARRVGVALQWHPSGQLALSLDEAVFPLATAVQALCQAALEPLQVSHAAPAVVVVPTFLPAAGLRAVEALVGALGVASVRTVSRAAALARAADLHPSARDITLTVSIGALGAEVALLVGEPASPRAFNVYDLGFWHADAEVHSRLGVLLLKQGVDVDDDATLADDLMGQISHHRRTQSAQWTISMAGAQVPVSQANVARWLGPLGERLVLWCDALMRQHLPSPQTIKHLVVAGDEPLWPGLVRVLQEQFRLSPIVLANGAWSRLDGALHLLRPLAAHESP